LAIRRFSNLFRGGARWAPSGAWRRCGGGVRFGFGRRSRSAAAPNVRRTRRRTRVRRERELLFDARASCALDAGGGERAARFREACGSPPRSPSTWLRARLAIGVGSGLAGDGERDTAWSERVPCGPNAHRARDPSAACSRPPCAVTCRLPSHSLRV
jgi:hypothetical protein